MITNIISLMPENVKKMEEIIMDKVIINVKGKEYVSTDFISKGLVSAAAGIADLCERKVHDKEAIAVSNAFQFLSETLKQLEDYNDEFEFGNYLMEQALADFPDLEEKLIEK